MKIKLSGAFSLFIALAIFTSNGISGEKRSRPGTADLLRKGIALLEGDSLAQAANLFRQVLAIAPKNREAMLYLTEIYLDLDMENQAFEWFDRLLALNPADYEILLKYLHALEGTGKETEQAKILKALFEINPKDMVVGLKYLKALENAGVSTHFKDYVAVLETLNEEPDAPALIREKFQNLKPAIDSVRQLEKAKQDSIQAVEKERRDSIQAVEKAKRDSIQAAEKVKRDSIQAAEKAKRDSIQAVEKAKRDSIEHAEKAFWNIIISVLNEESAPLDTFRIVQEIKSRLKNDFRRPELQKAGALLMFTRKKYPEALEFLRALKVADNTFNKLTALSYFRTNNYSEAADAFQKLNRKDLSLSLWKNYCLALQNSGQVKKAAMEYQALLKRHPDEEDALKYLISFYRKPLDSENLIPVLHAYSKKHPQKTELLLELADLSKNRPEEWAAFLANYIEKEPADMKTALELAEYYEETGKIAGAISLYQRYLERHKHDFSYLFKLGNLYRASGLMESAIAMYRDAGALKPSDSLLTIRLTDCYLEAGKKRLAWETWEKYSRLVLSMNQLDRAKAALLNSIRLGNPNPEINLLLAEIYMNEGETDRAEELLVQLIKRNKKSHKAYFVLAKTADKRQQKGMAVEYMLKAIKYAPDNVQYSEFLGGLFYASDEFDQAFKALDPVKEQLTPEAQTIYVDCLKKLGRKQSALDDFQNSFDVAASTPKAIVSLADSYIQANRPDKAIEVIQKSGFPENSRVKISLAQAYAMTGKTLEARSILKQVDAKQKKTAQFFLARGLTYFKEADFTTAEDEFSEAVVYDIQNTKAKHYLGICQLRLGKTKKARQLFNSTRDSYDKHTRALSFWGLALGFQREGNARAQKHHYLRALGIKWVPAIMADFIGFLAREGEAAEARIWASHLNKTDKAGNYAAQGRAEVLLMEGKLTEAETTIREGLKSHPFSCGLLLMSARTAKKADNIPLFEKRSTTVATLCADWPDNFLYRGLVFLHSNNKKAADRQFKKFRKYGGDIRLLPENL